ncbi:MATE family efflux transporter [Paenibacillus donghaensis]|uniref:Probable multidrug resistance protein NorM n=1 Tax=Paenibacillus donghaensis TaxID=414771 RepID=A0A2Z2K3U9_9BACL|nr:MATE family efflux transporter [Paenibacillus donghaensis]ASA20206.1 hypothetical protein B9T62_04955 [Paenibacillus donghaensis]
MLKQWIHHHRPDIRSINSLVLPMLLTQILQLLFQLGDQAIVGRLGIQEFAAVGIASSFIYLITGTIGILAISFTIIGGRYLGQNDTDSFGQAFNSGMTLSIVIGIISEVVILLGGRWILGTLYDMDHSVVTCSNYQVVLQVKPQPIPRINKQPASVCQNAGCLSYFVKPSTINSAR